MNEGMGGLRGWFALVLVIGAVLRLAYVDRPFDHRLRTSWRQSDYVQIARNYDREGMNILYPRIDWRGDTPGYVEAEFPLVPWFGALLYRVLGYNIVFLRMIAAFFSLAALFLFAWFARSELPGWGALFATAAYAANPLLVYLSTAIQPESLMLFLSLAAFALIRRWERTPSFMRLLAASAAVAAAILAKSTAASLGLVLAYVILKKQGRKAFSDYRVYLGGLAGVVPPLVWYSWARHFWKVYGNSLGISNETHFIGADILFPPWFLVGNLKWETLGVLSPVGWLLAGAALAGRRTVYAPALVWYSAVWAFYVVAARTSGDDWAYYYHSSSAAPACLLMGAGVAALLERESPPQAWFTRWRKGIVAGLSACTLAGLLAVAAFLIHLRDSNASLLAMRNCALELADKIPPSEKIVVKGGRMFDEQGHPVAFNEPMVFAWMDRKGFNYGLEEQNIETLDRIAARGGRYWMVLRRDLEQEGLRPAPQRYRLVAEYGEKYVLYDLSRGPEEHP
jgi:4-amino-4-deoxy-L-arabinose transferase-like glycosyltransferase